MKNGHTIFFNIAACNKYNLGPTDAYILDWIYRFAHSGKMYSIRHREENTGNIMTYYWVLYDKLIRDFGGFLKFQSTKNLKNQHINKYVQSGILYKFVYTVPKSDSKGHTMAVNIPKLPDGRQLAPGNYTFFAINEDIYLELMGETDIGDGQICTPVPDKSDLDPPEENFRTNITTSSNNNTTTTSVGTLHDNDNSGMIDNESIGLGNIDADNTAELKTHIRDLFGDKSYLQGEDFMHNLVGRMNYVGITDLQDQKDYVTWVFGYSKSRANKRLSSYFRSVACNADLMREFLDDRDKQRTQEDLKIRANTMKCPVCDTYHYIGSVCPECGLVDPADTASVTRLINIRKLPLYTQAQLNRRIDALYKECDLSDMGAILDRHRQKEKIYAEYGV